MNIESLQRTLSAYTFERELGGGGMSRVFLAQEHALGRQVVVKLLSEELASGVSADRFKREIQVVAQLQHPNIVPLLSAGDADGLPYFTMPYVQGESLRARISRGGELSVAEALRVLRDVARALDYAHQHGVVHRDIKPDNVLLSGDYALVTDFGVGKALSVARRAGDETLTQFGVAVGTPAYMAPEQAAGDGSLDHRADIYAFGCVAYEMLAGHPPFEGRSAQELLAAQITKDPTPIRERRPSVPEPLAALVMRCLEKRPADRPQSARELVQALESVTTPVGGTGVGLGLSAPLARRSFNRFAIGAGVVLVLAVGGGLLARWLTPASPLNDALVTVLPFRVSAADPSLRYLREGMVDLVAAKLTGDKRAVDPRTVLAAWRRGGGSETVDLTEQQGLAVARSLHSARVLQGEIVGNAGQLVISGTLLDAARGTPRARARVQGDARALAALVDSLVARLLVIESGGTEQQAVLLAGIPFSALQSYLAGQRAYRAGRYTDATEAYSAALTEDSTFAQAGLGLRMSAGWYGDGPRMTRGAAVARRHRDKLSARDQLLLDVVAGQGQPRTCREAMAAQEAAVERAPDVAEFWYELADNMLHCGDAMGMDGMARSLPAFERALAIDSGFTPAWEHVPSVLLWLGDSARARQAFAQYVRGQPEMAMAWQYAMFADSAERERLIPDVAASRPFYIAAYGGVLGTLYEPREVRFSELVLEQVRRHVATESDRQELLRVERILALNRGQPERAARVGRQHVAYSTAERILDAVFHEGDSTLAADAMVQARRAIADPSRLERTPWVNTVFAAGLYDGARRNASGAAAAAASLRAMPVPAESIWVREGARRYAMVLDAQHAVVTNAPDARRVVAAADSMLREGPPGVQLRAAGNLAIANLWERVGDVPSAYAASKRVYMEPTFMPFWSTYKRERARLAAVNGNVEDAIKHYREYLAMRYDPEPSLRAHIASVKSELARLERQSAGR